MLLRMCQFLEWFVDIGQATNNVSNALTGSQYTPVGMWVGNSEVNVIQLVWSATFHLVFCAN